ncbi:MAG: SDR family oxidoreductase [Pacificimonas sp.]|jgi:NAD(P)-dependent dehydrogenase (short-subunit alcohol dehydrogenase family)|nr:SDR family oxidoreductase [Pacificimonas sp.]
MAQDRPLALVTGGTKRLGAAIAAALAGAGYDLALHYRSDAAFEPDLAEAVARSGAHAEIFQADFADRDSRADTVAAVCEAFARPPTLLVNSASLFGTDRLETTDVEALTQHFLVNAAAPALLSKAFAAHLGGGEGSIVNILDQRLMQPNADNFAYTLSKFALAGMTETLSRSLAPKIRVNAVAPGLTIPTDAYTPSAMAALGEAMPLGRLPTPTDVAEAAVYLARASSVTGQTLFVDGGARHRYFVTDFDRL